MMVRVAEVRDMCINALKLSVGVLDRWYVRMAALLGFVLALVSTVVNMVLVPIVNYQMMPEWQLAASQATQRKVRQVWGWQLAVT
jgi:hypothetical protein